MKRNEDAVSVHESVEYQFRIDYCLNLLPYIVHPPHPLNLVFGLELLRYALAGGVLLHKQIAHLVSLAVYFLQMGVQLAAEEQPGLDGAFILLQIVLTALIPDAVCQGGNS